MNEIICTNKVLQISNKQGAVPAGWPENELIENHIIVPSAKDEETVAKRLNDKI